MAQISSITQFSVVNGAGYKNPTRTKDVDFEGRVGVNPISWLTVGGGFYSGHLGQITAANENFPKHTATRFDGLVAVNIIGIHVGGEWYQAKNYKTVNTLAASRVRHFGRGKHGGRGPCQRQGQRLLDLGVL